MKKNEFDALFMDVKQKLLDVSEQETLEQLRSYTENPAHMTLEEGVTYAKIEAIKYANDLVYNLLLATVVDKD